jgi:hypothetical protein
VVSRNWTYLGSSPGGSDLREKVDVRLVVFAPLTRKVVLVIDSLNWANRLTGTTVHALIRVDVKHSVTLIDAVNRALVNTCLVFNIYTRKSDYVCHLTPIENLILNQASFETIPRLA